MPSAGFGSIPVLGIYKETVSLGVSWTGPGPVVSVWRAGSSLPCGAAEWRTSPKHPVSGVVGGGGRPPPAPLCAYNATSLAHPGGLYAFRIAAHNAAGWSPHGPASATARLIAVRPPPRPLAPVFAVLDDSALPRGSAVFYASTPPNAAQQAAASAPPAATYELQYRQDESSPWVDAPAPIDVDGSGWATATLYGLEAGAAVFARSRAANAAGASPWSLSSNGGVATRDPKPPVPSAPVATLDGGDGAILVRFLPFAADGLGSRSATVARHFELGTQAWKGRGFAAPVGWDVAYDRPLPYVSTEAVDEVQLATSRCDSGAISGGTFRLRLPVLGAYERGTVTGDLPFDASAFAVKKALEALDVIPEGSLAVTRHTPGALESHAPARGAFAWKVHFKDIGAVAGADLRATVFVPDARTTYFDVNVTAGDEWCLRDVDIYVRISHPCASQLSISVVGPGPVSGDGNFRDPVAASWPVLLHAPEANLEACDRLDPPFSTQDALDDFGYKGDPGMLFDDDAPVDVRAPDAKNPYGGTFRPVDALAEFEGARPSGTWTLVVTDHSGGLRKNYNAANLTAFRVVSRLERCERRYVWRNVTNATGDAPPALAGALGVSTGDSLFVYGGRTASDPFPDKALWRYDVLTNAWTALSAAPQPEGVYDPVGKAAVITPWGIYAFGGLGGWHDERGLPCSQFDTRVLWLDMLSNRWWGLDDEVWPGPHEIEVDPGRHRVDGASVVAATVEAVNDRPAPRGRYYASLAYLEPGVADVVSAAADVRAGLLPDTDAAVPPAILLFGGDDDFSDLDDAWLLKLGNASLRHTSDPRFEFHLSPSFHFAFCGWRFQGKSQELWDASCGANATTSPMEDCEFVEVLQRAYCEHQYQSLNHLPY